MKIIDRFIAWWRASLVPYVRDHVVPDVRSTWRMLSVQFMTAAAALQAAWASFDETLKQYLPNLMVTYITIALLLLGIGGRIVKQKKPGGDA